MARPSLAAPRTILAAASATATAGCADDPARGRSAATSDLGDRLDGADDRDQPVALGGRANIVPSNQNGIVFGRTQQHTLNILYGNPARGVMQGGFFP